MKSINVVIISIDTVREEAFARSDFKYFKKLRAHGAYFHNTYCVAPLTPVSHASLFSGLYPARHGVRHLFRESISPTTSLLAEMLERRGYATGGFVSCAGMDRWYGFARGFGVYDDDLPLLPDGRRAVETASMASRGATYRDGSATTERAIAWLRDQRRDRPFFCFLHLFDAHLPYDPPPAHRNRYEHPYYGGVEYVESLVRRFIDEAKIDLQNTLLVLVSDHGEDLGEHGKPTGEHKHEEGHGCLLTEETLRVPLLIVGPGIPPTQASNAPASLLDVLPTILGYIGVMPGGALDGRQLLNDRGEIVEHSQRTLLHETHFPEELPEPIGPLPALYGFTAFGADASRVRMIYTAEERFVALYDLIRDPCERMNLFDQIPSDLRPRASAAFGDSKVRY